MGRSRLELHEHLCDILRSKNCYFRPPDSMQLRYPCIIYDHENTYVEHADDFAYKRDKRYSITVIDDDPDSEIPEKLFEEFNYISSDRNFKVDGLNHFTFTLFY